MKRDWIGKLKKETAAVKRPFLAFLVFLAVCACGWLLPTAATAAVPVMFTYQGNLRQDGFLVSGQRSMVFRIYNSSTSASALWTSSAQEVSLSTGVFRVVLQPVIADWESGSLWLELEVEGNRMAPREELTSSPYAINSLLLSGKQYTTSASTPTASSPGDLWYDSSANVVSFWNGSSWVPTSGSGLPGPHASTHGPGGSDPIVALGTHTVTGYITVSSSVIAGWFMGDGSGLTGLNASTLASGLIPGDRLGNIIVSTNIVDGAIQTQDLADASVTKAKLNQSGCALGQVLAWSGAQWACSTISGSGSETDPWSIHNQDTLQAGTTFYVSSGTVTDLNVNNSLKVMGTALINGAPGQQGLSVEATGNVAIGMTGASARLEVKGADTQNYSFAVSTGTAHQVVVSTSGAVGIGTENPAAKLDVTGDGSSGQYLAVFHSGNQIAAWLKTK
jgi:hypothetical protein